MTDQGPKPDCNLHRLGRFASAVKVALVAARAPSQSHWWQAEHRPSRAPAQQSTGPAALALIGIIHDDIAIQPAPRCPAAFNGHFARLDYGNEIIHDPVCDSLVENAFVTKSLKIHFQALQFHANLIRDISKHDRSVVRLPCFRTDRSELRTMMFNRKVSRRAWIIKDFQGLTEII